MGISFMNKLILVSLLSLVIPKVSLFYKIHEQINEFTLIPQISIIDELYFQVFI